MGRGWALEIETFLGPVNWHRADRRVPFNRVPGRFNSISAGLKTAVIRCLKQGFTLVSDHHGFFSS